MAGILVNFGTAVKKRAEQEEEEESNTKEEPFYPNTPMRRYMLDA